MERVSEHATLAPASMSNGANHLKEKHLGFIDQLQSMKAIYRLPDCTRSLIVLSLV